jgi:hypothetical protein
MNINKSSRFQPVKLSVKDPKNDYFSNARQKSAKIKNYFDDDDDDDEPIVKDSLSKAVDIDDDFDPLDAFM